MVEGGSMVGELGGCDDLRRCGERRRSCGWAGLLDWVDVLAD